MSVVEILGGLNAYNEAVLTQLAGRGIEPGVKIVGSVWVAVVHCDEEVRWDRLAELALDPECVVVAVLPTLELDGYIRALSQGASGLVYIGMPSAITADVVEAAIEGEVVLPRQAAQNIAVLAKRELPVSSLSEPERAMLQAVASGQTIVDLAEELHYSERTVRRHLQSIYIKLGVQNRAAAIAAATRLGLTT